MEQTVAVVGAGISGLSFAHFCAQANIDVQVFEKELMGGSISSCKLDEGRYAEFGAHTLTNKYRTTLEILEYYQAVGQMVPAAPLRFSCYTGNEFHSVFKDISWLEIFKSLPRALTHKKQGSVEEYYSRILGRKNYRALFHYAFQAVLCQDPDSFPAELLFKKRYSNKSYPAKFTLKEGMSQLLNLILEHPSITCNYQSVTALSKEEDDYVLWSNGRQLARTKNLCLSCSADVSANLLRNIEPALAGLLSGIASVNVESLLVSDIPETAGANQNRSIIGVDQPFYSAILNRAGNRKYWMFHFAENTGTVEQKLGVIAKVFNVSVQSIRVLGSRASTLPKVTVAHLDILKKIDAELANKRIYIASNYMEGLSVEDCCLRGKTQAEKFLLMN